MLAAIWCAAGWELILYGSWFFTVFALIFHKLCRRRLYLFFTRQFVCELKADVSDAGTYSFFYPLVRVRLMCRLNLLLTCIYGNIAL